METMPDWFVRLVDEIAARPDGPLAMRFYLQPMMSTFFALRDGCKDAREGKAPYFWSIFTDPLHLRDLLQDGWRSVGKIFILAAVLDVVYQLLVLHGLRPIETLLVATLLAIIPYVAFRGPVNRIARAVRRFLVAHGLLPSLCILILSANLAAGPPEVRRITPPAIHHHCPEVFAARLPEFRRLIQRHELHILLD
jgi:hypothetical protein